MNRWTRPILAGLLVVAFLPIALEAQERSAEESAVFEPIERLFDGMRANDGEMVRSAFADGAVMVRSTGDNAVAAGSVDGFIGAVAQATESWDEPIWDSVVQIAGDLATVWTKYAFYRGETFSHCGYDAFILAKGTEGWKISVIADSRQTENCEMPPGR